MSFYHGDTLHLELFGSSHASAVGVTMTGFPAEFTLDRLALQDFLDRRAPGNSRYATTRKESDLPQFLSGMSGHKTDGTPLTAIIANTDVRSSDYDTFRDIPRPGHADYTAHLKYRGRKDIRGGGAFSGRMTAPLCIAGGMAKQYLAMRDIHIEAAIDEIEGSKEDPYARIEQAQAEGDSVGGTISCRVSGFPAGCGGPLFEGIESKLAPLLFAIPAIRGLEFGAGFAATTMRGSAHNDAFFYREDGTVATRTNHHGGILGGISSGMDLLFRVAVKPTPSIARKQESISYRSKQSATLEIRGRHDPCIVPRALPCVEAAAALALLDLLLTEEAFPQANARDALADHRAEIDRIDRSLLFLIEKRLRIAERIAQYKKEHNRQVLDPEREKRLLQRIASLSSDDLSEANLHVFRHLLEASRSHQQKAMDENPLR